MAPIRRSATLLATGSTVLAVLLTGCVFVVPTPTTPSPLVTEPSASPTPTATDDPDTGPAVDCDTIVSDATRDSFEASGLALFPPEEFYAKNESEGHPGPYALMDANGGVVCPWHAESEVIAAYGYSPLAADQVDEAIALIGDGNPNTASPYADGTLYTSATESNPFGLFFITDGAWYVGTTIELIDEIRAIVP